MFRRWSAVLRVPIRTKEYQPNTSQTARPLGSALVLLNYIKVYYYIILRARILYYVVLYYIMLYYIIYYYYLLYIIYCIIYYILYIIYYILYIIYYILYIIFYCEYKWSDGLVCIFVSCIYLYCRPDDKLCLKEYRACLYRLN